MNILDEIKKDFGIERENEDFINWCNIASILMSEELINKYIDYLPFSIISSTQNLSEDFLEKHFDELNYLNISSYQKLSESFIEKHLGDLELNFICKYQKLSEKFINEYRDLLNWMYICKYQKLSEDFIKKHASYVDWRSILRYQKLSKEFINSIEDEIKVRKLQEAWLYLKDSWHYKTTEEKKQAVIDTGLYECHDDYFVAYKAIRADRYSLFNFQYRYEKGGVYESWCDCSNAEDSFGLSVGTIKFCKNYARTWRGENIVKVKIKYEDVGRVVHGASKIRCFKIEILE